MNSNEISQNLHSSVIEKAAHNGGMSGSGLSFNASYIAPVQNLDGSVRMNKTSAHAGGAYTQDILLLKQHEGLKIP